MYGKERIIRKRENTKQLQEYRNLKCTYSTVTEQRYIIEHDVENYEIKDEYIRKIFNHIKKGYNTFELLVQQEKDHKQLLEAIQYLKDTGYIYNNIILKNK